MRIKAGTYKRLPLRMRLRLLLAHVIEHERRRAIVDKATN